MTQSLWYAVVSDDSFYLLLFLTFTSSFVCAGTLITLEDIPDNSQLPSKMMHKAEGSSSSSSETTSTGYVLLHEAKGCNFCPSSFGVIGVDDTVPMVLPHVICRQLGYSTGTTHKATHYYNVQQGV